MHYFAVLFCFLWHDWTQSRLPETVQLQLISKAFPIWLIEVLERFILGKLGLHGLTMASSAVFTTSRDYAWHERRTSPVGSEEIIITLRLMITACILRKDSFFPHPTQKIRLKGFHCWLSVLLHKLAVKEQQSIQWYCFPETLHLHDHNHNKWSGTWSAACNQISPDQVKKEKTISVTAFLSLSIFTNTHCHLWCWQRAMTEAMRCHRLSLNI